jgi:hypothetical protein
MTTIETYTPKRIIRDIIPEHYGDLTQGKDTKFTFLFANQLVDGSAGCVAMDGEPLLTFRVRFTNTTIFGEEAESVYVKCELTDVVMTKPKVEKQVVDVSEDNVAEPVSKPAETPKQPANKTLGRGRGANKK